MPDVPDSPETPVLPAQAEPIAPQPPPSAEGALPAPMRSPLTNGQRWRNYQIGDPLDTDTGWCYQCVNVSTLEDVQIRVLPYGGPGDMRAQAWQELQSLDKRGLIRGFEAIEEGDFRYEVSQPPPTTTLHEWASCRQATLDDVQTLVQQIGEVLIALHDRGIVHLNLRMDTIYLPSDGAGLQVSIGGLEHVTVYNQAELIPVPVDPLYAPPEAAGLTKHSPGAGLRAWDWWSLGRILQELVLGRHVLGVVMNRDISRASPEIRARAEALLLERDPKAPRAGAVELMPSMSQRQTDLLRGLLTSSRDGRWGADEVQRWLKQQPVKDRYQLARNEQLFGWKDRMFTVAEAADFFAHEENWADGVTNFFETDNPTTLAYFVGDRPEYRQVHERIENLQRFMQIPNWEGLPVEARQTAVLAAAWLLLGGEDAKLLIYGHKVDATCIKGLFARGVAEGVSMVKAITAQPYVEMIVQNDPDAARLLSTLAATVTGEAVVRAISQGWMDLSNPADYARLLLLAMDSERKLFDLRTSLLERFACSREEHIQHLLTQPKLTHSELVLLASTAAQPDRYGYVTHDDWKRERYEALKKRSVQLATALFWLRLGAATRAGYVLFGPMRIVFGIWIAVGLVAGWPQGLSHLHLWVLGAAGAFTAMRIGTSLWLNLLVRKHAANAESWKLFTPLERCTREARGIFGTGDIAISAQALSGELAAICIEVAKLGLKPPPPPLPKPGLALPAWSGSLASWAMFIVALAVGYWKPSESSAKMTLDPKTVAIQAIENALKPAPPEEKPSAEDFFYENPTKPRARWNMAKPAVAQTAPITKVQPASSDEVARVLIDGQRLLLPYQHNSIDALIAVPVGEKEGSGFML